jgi:predicted RNA-binding protein with TRAM domain
VAGAELLQAVSPQRFYGRIKLRGIAEAEMGAADHGVDIFDSCLIPGVLDGVDQTRVAAAEEEDQSPVTGDDQRLVIGNLVHCAPCFVAEDSGVPPLEGGPSRHLAGQEDPPADLTEPVVQGKPSPRCTEKMLPMGNADGEALSRILNPVTTGEYCRMGEDLLAAESSQKRQEPAAMVAVAVGEGHLPNTVEIVLHAPGIVDEGRPLAGVKEETTPVPLHQGGETVFTEGAGKRPDGIVAKYGYTVFHNNPGKAVSPDTENAEKTLKTVIEFNRVIFASDSLRDLRGSA